ncbi:Gliding motility regulatory protein [Planctomycetes bacterium Poly30]|uniref:histidine kinase n=1 Tax=Saltatorellus ferox TaxID=2528018 RepID=A0A518F0V6_9BACT|nr:Gliding motility regulatory protein [Planctomycetes bacterium Poly30]
MSSTPQHPDSPPIHPTGGEPTSLWTRFLSAAVLPKTVSAFEASYLARMNKIALWFFIAHLPVFMLVAWANDTGVVSVALMTLAVLAVPVLGCRAIESERRKSYVFAFTSMCMGGVLVHAGQGPVQIEMHFYFFSILAILALFANPMTVIVGAGTVAVHHLALWYLAPASIFNYDAPLWVVLVHAAFVVLEAFAAGFIARNFFDNVIGLEKKVEERTAQLRERNREMQVVLDSIEQGIVTVDASCQLLPEHSSSIETFFGEFVPGETFADYLSRSCVTTAEWFSMNWEALADGFLPMELAIDQLPKHARIGESSYDFEYRTKLDDSGELEAVLIVVSDKTNEVAREHAEALQREVLTMLERAMKDERGFAAFYKESTALLAKVEGASHESATSEEKRALHTMKGNAAAFGLGSISKACHELENAWGRSTLLEAETAFEALKNRWLELGETAERLLGDADEDTIRVPASQLETLLELAVDGGSEKLAAELAELLLEPTSPALERLESQALQIAERLERSPLKTHVESHGVRVQRASFQPLWSALVHVIRNAIDHGIEAPEERLDADKDAAGKISIRTQVVDGSLIVTVEDDGRGIDWERVRTKACEVGLPNETCDDLVNALFATEFTTRDSVSELSGRGVGLAAVANAIENLKGSISVTSLPGEGTRMQFVIPLETHSTQLVADSAQSRQTS